MTLLRYRCALAPTLLLAGVFALTRQAAAQADVTTAIQDVVQLIAKDVEQKRPRAEIRQLDHAVQNLLKALEHQSGGQGSFGHGAQHWGEHYHHHHAHHQHGSFSSGMKTHHSSEKGEHFVKFAERTPMTAGDERQDLDARQAKPTRNLAPGAAKEGAARKKEAPKGGPAKTIGELAGKKGGKTRDRANPVGNQANNKALPCGVKNGTQSDLAKNMGARKNGPTHGAKAATPRQGAGNRQSSPTANVKCGKGDSALAKQGSGRAICQQDANRKNGPGNLAHKKGNTNNALTKNAETATTARRAPDNTVSSIRSGSCKSAYGGQGKFAAGNLVGTKTASRNAHGSQSANRASFKSAPSHSLAAVAKNAPSTLSAGRRK
jgi:hypothetical protein